MPETPAEHETADLFRPAARPVIPGPPTRPPAAPLPVADAARAAAADPSGPPGRRGARRAGRTRWVAGAAIVALVAAGGVAVLLRLQDASATRAQRAKARTAYSAAHKAYLVGDCTLAATQFDGALAIGLAPDLVPAATAQLAACLELSELRVAPGLPAPRVERFLGYLADDPPAPLDDAAAEDTDRLLATTPLDQLASAALCARLDDVRSLVGRAVPQGVGTPRLMLGCGEAARKAGDLERAGAVLTALRKDFPSSPQAVTAGISLSKMKVDDDGLLVRVGGSKATPDGGLGDRARVVVHNGTPGELLVAVSGAANARRAVGPCTGCPVGAKGSEPRCALNGTAAGPQTVLDLPAGRYVTRVRATGSGRVTVSSWTLEPGSVLDVCFGATRSR